MGVLAHPELERRIDQGQLILRPRRKNGRLDIQPASYDLTAGRAVWKDKKSGKLIEESYDATKTIEQQPTVCLEPGQMLSIVTHEEIKMPIDHCGMVYSKNGLALKGIFAFNAGHVDPGFEGPIVVRLINLRANQYTVTLGHPIFTIVFERLEISEADRPNLKGRRPLSMEETIKSVREFADVALSNALFDLYAQPIESRLSEHRSEALMTIRTELAKEFVRQDKLNEKILLVMVVTAAALMTILVGFVVIAKNLSDSWSAIRTFIGF